MYPVSAQFLQAIRYPHVMVAYVEAWQAGVKINPAIAFSSGTVTFDRGSDVFGTLDITLQLEGLDLATDPLTADRPLNIYGLELRPFRGIRYRDGSQEVVPCGRFIVDSFDYATHESEVHVSASDYSLFVSDDRFAVPVIPGWTGRAYVATQAKAYIQTLVSDAAPAGCGVFNSDDYAAAPATTIPKGTTYDEDRLAAIHDLANGIGRIVHPDRIGLWRMDVPPDQDSAPIPVWTIDTGDQGVLVAGSSSEARDPVYNAVFARSESDGEIAPVHGEAYLTDVNSPAVWGGPFGKKPMFYTSSFFTTNAQCLAYAKVLLAQVTGTDRDMTLQIVPNPALDPGDGVWFIDERNNKQKFMVTSIAIPLAPEDIVTVTVTANRGWRA